jgi:hypothetical protein
VPSVAAKKVEKSQISAAKELQREICDAHQLLQGCFEEMETVLAQPVFNATALTSVRLKLAGIRLTRGPLIMKTAQLLAENITESEAAMLEQLRSSHQHLLQTATMHTSKWTLAAIKGDWVQYRRETRELMRKWIAKADREQRLVSPLVQRCAEYC